MRFCKTTIKSDFASFGAALMAPLAPKKRPHRSFCVFLSPIFPFACHPSWWKILGRRQAEFPGKINVDRFFSEIRVGNFRENFSRQIFRKILPPNFLPKFPQKFWGKNSITDFFLKNYDPDFSLKFRWKIFCPKFPWNFQPKFHEEISLKISSGIFLKICYRDFRPKFFWEFSNRNSQSWIFHQISSGIFFKNFPKEFLLKILHRNFQS